MLSPASDYEGTVQGEDAGAGGSGEGGGSDSGGSFERPSPFAPPPPPPRGGSAGGGGGRERSRSSGSGRGMSGQQQHGGAGGGGPTAAATHGAGAGLRACESAGNAPPTATGASVMPQAQHSAREAIALALRSGGSGGGGAGRGSPKVAASGPAPAAAVAAPAHAVAAHHELLQTAESAPSPPPPGPAPVHRRHRSTSNERLARPLAVRVPGPVGSTAGGASAPAQEAAPHTAGPRHTHGAGFAASLDASGSASRTWAHGGGAQAAASTESGSGSRLQRSAQEHSGNSSNSSPSSRGVDSVHTPGSLGATASDMGDGSSSARAQRGTESSLSLGTGGGASISAVGGSSIGVLTPGPSEDPARSSAVRRDAFRFGTPAVSPSPAPAAKVAAVDRVPESGFAAAGMSRALAESRTGPDATLAHLAFTSPISGREVLESGTAVGGTGDEAEAETVGKRPARLASGGMRGGGGASPLAQASPTPTAQAVK